jgi:hypothetical protein
MNISAMIVRRSHPFVKPSLRRLGDDHVNFDCTKRKGYDMVKFAVDTNPQWKTTIEKVCASNHLGAEHQLNWRAPMDYSLDMGPGIEQTKSKDYDHLSIMQYESWVYAKDLNGGVADMPLVRWKNGRPEDGSKPNDDNAQLIPDVKAISDGDQDAIKSLYPLKN